MPSQCCRMAAARALLVHGSASRRGCGAHGNGASSAIFFAHAGSRERLLREVTSMETVSITAEREGITNGTAELQARLFAKVVAPFADQLTTAQPGEVYRAMIALLERALFNHALALTGGNQLRAARLLGVNRNTLRKRCRDLGLEPSRRRPAGLAP